MRTSGFSGSNGTSGSSGVSGTSGTSGFLPLIGTTNNGVITWDNPLLAGNVESNLTFDGSTLSVTGNVTATTSIGATTFLSAGSYIVGTQYRETFSDLGTGGSVIFDLSTGNNFKRTFNGAATITFNNAPASNAFGFTLTTVNAGAYVINWPPNVDWVGGTAPVLTSAGVDVLTFFTFDGGISYYGFVVGKNLS